MKISYNWLKNYVKTKYSPERLSEILTDTGLEVEGLNKVETIKGGLEGVVIGEVKSCVNHENSDHLKITKVDIGEKEELQIICGAPNVEEGQKVVVATVGTTLYPTPDEPFKIKKAKMRGVESVGMLCSEKELNLGDAHEGIMVLPEEAKVGTPAAAYFNIESDYCIEIGLTPNRSDALGHYGVARDLVAYNKVNDVDSKILEFPDISGYEIFEKGEQVKIKVENPEDCPIYMGCVISEVVVKPSPDWLRNYLQTIGLTPINNIVDITNFVMHELGTPLHAFDLGKVGNEIVVKRAKKGEKFTTLDEVERTLFDEDLMITNGKKNLCIAGVFGGADSGVNEETTSIFLEAAYFDAVSVRKTAKRHGLNTDASFRYERGVDPNMIEFAMKRAASLIVKYAEGIISHEPIPYEGKQIESKEVFFRYSNCNKLIGKEIPSAEIVTILNALDFEIAHSNEDQIKVKVPTYRVDVTREADIIEEVLRIYGFNNVEIPTKWSISLSNQDLRSEEQRQNAVSDLLVGKGFYEMMNNSLISSKWIAENGNDFLKNEHSVEMLNPLSADLNIMRQTLVYQGLTSIAHNNNRQTDDVGLFEFGKVYQKFNDKYHENKRLSIFLTGKKAPEQWNTKAEAVSFFSLKGIVKAVFMRLGIEQFITTKPLKNSLLQDGVQLYVQKFKIGEIGWTSSKMNKSFGVKQKVFVADLDWDMILNLGNRNKVGYKELPKTFAMRRDFSLLIDVEISFKEIEEIARKSTNKLLRKVDLFDVYDGDKLPDGKKSYAVSFYFQNDEKTLKDNKVDKLMQNIREQLEKQLKAELR